MKIYVDGQFVDSDTASLKVHDAAVQHGVGLFETMQAFDGKVYRLNDHMQRLVASCKELGLASSLSGDALGELVELTLKQNNLTEARLRLTLTGGDLSLMGAARDGGEVKPHQPSVICVATEPTQYPPEFFTQGIAVVIADPKANPFDPTSGHKTINYWLRLQTLAAASTVGAGEAIWLSISNHLASGAVSNLFVVKDQQLLTPIAQGEEEQGALHAPVLPGITRKVVIELAQKQGVEVIKKMLTITDLLDADELFLTNSSWLVLPVVRVEKETIGAGKVGQLAQQLRQAVMDDIAGMGATPS